MKDCWLIPGKIKTKVAGWIDTAKDYVAKLFESAKDKLGKEASQEVAQKGASVAGVSADDINFTDKFNKPGYGNQVASRGWNNQKIADAINNPYKVVDSVNTFAGNPAKVYFINETHYVVIDSATNKIVQVSNLNISNWKFTPGDFTE